MSLITVSERRANEILEELEELTLESDDEEVLDDTVSNDTLDDEDDDALCDDCDEDILFQKTCKRTYIGQNIIKIKLKALYF